MGILCFSPAFISHKTWLWLILLSNFSQPLSLSDPDRTDSIYELINKLKRLKDNSQFFKWCRGFCDDLYGMKTTPYRCPQGVAHLQHSKCRFLMTLHQLLGINIVHFCHLIWFSSSQTKLKKKKSTRSWIWNFWVVILWGVTFL